MENHISEFGQNTTSIKRQIPWRLWVLIISGAVIITPSLVALFTRGCNPVSVEVQTWGIHYKFQKGGCSNLSEAAEK